MNRETQYTFFAAHSTCCKGEICGKVVQSVFNMFSDLKVTKESNNHWWMPQMTVFPYLERQYQVNGISTSCDVVSSSLSTRASSTTTDIQLKRSLYRNCGPESSAEIGDSLNISGRQFLEYSLLERKLVVFEWGNKELSRVAAFLTHSVATEPVSL